MKIRTRVAIGVSLALVVMASALVAGGWREHKNVYCEQLQCQPITHDLLTPQTTTHCYYGTAQGPPTGVTSIEFGSCAEGTTCTCEGDVENCDCLCQFGDTSQC